MKTPRKRVNLLKWI